MDQSPGCIGYLLGDMIGRLLYNDERDGRVTHMCFTPLDEVYAEGYSLLY